MGRKYLRGSIAGIILSLGISLLVISISKTPIEDVLAIPPIMLALSLMLNLARFSAQGLRLHILLKKHSTIPVRYSESFAMRGASEFFALTTLPFMADEAARTWFLTERGERGGRAFWISFVEMLVDTLVGGMITAAAGLNAILAGIYYIAAPVLAISLTQLITTVGFMALVKTANGGWLRGMMEVVVERFPLPATVRRNLKNGSDDMIKIIGSTISAGQASALTYLLLSTTVIMTAPALILQLLSGSCNFVGCLYAFHSGNALGVLPATVGGAGLTEAGVYLYLSGVLGIDSMATVIQWRIATYYLSLIISGTLFIIVALGRR